jgi:NAD(P)H-dependent flavin oxidoreductase YrpB (nitropropane dioxygenase family)
MKTTVSEMFDVELPIFAFSHCRDVVAAVTNAGGFGVLGAASFGPEQLERELCCIDEQVRGKPYGVDVVMPAKQAQRDGGQTTDLRGQFMAMIPQEHRDFTERLLDEHGVKPLDDPDDVTLDATGLTHEGASQLLEIAFAHPISLLVNALGPMPQPVAERARAQGIKTAGLVGSVEHARKQLEVGVDLVIAQGTEAGGHCGEIATMVLVPEVVDAVTPVPVLAAGGIGTGRQVAAAIALGAEGVWTGSIWLTCAESSVAPVLRENLLAAGSGDTVRSRAMSGKPARQLRTAWTDAWDARDAPPPLQVPLQTLLYAPAKDRIERFGVAALSGEAVGQIVGTMRTVRSARDIVFDLASGTADAVARLHTVFPSEP